MTDHDTEVLVARFNLRTEAALAQGFLDNAGIGSVVRADDGGGVFGAPLSYSMDSFAEVVVLASNAEEARRLLLDAGYTVLDAAGSEVAPEGTEAEGPTSEY